MIAAIIGAVVEVGKWLADKAVTIGLVIYHASRIVALALFHFGGAVAKVFGKAWDLLSRFYTRVLRPLVEWSWRNIQKLHAWLKDTFGPVLKVLQTVRRDILKIYEKWLRPIFDTISVLRSLTRVLAAFHVPFARKIDDALARLEARLLLPIRFALEKINEAINWINRIVDFNGYFQRLTLVASALRYERDMWRVWWASVHNREQERAKAPRDNTVPAVTPPAASEETRVFVTKHEGPNAARITEAAHDLRLRLGVR